MKLITLVALMVLNSQAAEIDKDFYRFAVAINRVEANGRRAQVRPGDAGKAIGPLQIHKAYWYDAVQSDPSLGGTHQDCQHWDYSIRVMRACLRRYAPQALSSKDWQTLARIHNGGPTGSNEQATKKYWLKVKLAM